MQILLNKYRALEYVRGFREQHISEYKEQFKGWQTSIEAHADTLKEWSQAGAQGKKPEELPRPVNHLKHYEDLIQKLTLHQADTILVEDSDYEEIVHNKFHWTRQWSHSNATYSVASHGSLSSSNVPEDHVEIE